MALAFCTRPLNLCFLALKIREARQSAVLFNGPSAIPTISALDFWDAVFGDRGSIFTECSGLSYHRSAFSRGVPTFPPNLIRIPLGGKSMVHKLRFIIRIIKNT